VRRGNITACLLRRLFWLRLNRAEQLEGECAAARRDAAGARREAEGARGDAVKLVERVRYLQSRYSATRAARLGAGGGAGFEVLQVDADGAEAQPVRAHLLLPGSVVLPVSSCFAGFLMS
jgi:hypothetical protein